jgi:hypothetical protein
MIPLAYIDVRPFIFVGGLPLFIGIVLLAVWLLGLKWKKGKVSLISSLVFTGLFTLFLTGIGPFVDQKEIREYEMTWSIAQTPSTKGMKEAEVVLRFVEFPQYAVGEYSDELAAHLQKNAEGTVTAKFRVTYDYGKVRGYSVREIAGLSGWKSEWGYGSVSGSPEDSPWN